MEVGWWVFAREGVVRWRVAHAGRGAVGVCGEGFGESGWGRLRRMVWVDSVRFGFVPWRGAADVVFMVRLLRDRCLAGGGDLWMAFVDLERAFGGVPRGGWFGGRWDIWVWMDGWCL